MLSAITTVGLVDVENREEAERHVPPTTFYNFAKREIAMTGVTAHTTFKQHRNVFLNALREGKKIYILILHPDSEQIPALSDNDKLKLKGEIISTIDIITTNGIHEQHGFHLRFMHMPHLQR